MKNSLFLSLIISIVSCLSYCYGEPVYDFLSIATSARDNALGGFHYTIDWGGNGINPARLALSEGHQAFAGFRSYLVDSNLGCIGGIYKLDEDFNLGAGMNFLSYGSMKRTTIDNPTGDGLGEFSALDMSFYAGIAVKLNDFTQAGITVKPVLSRIDENKSFGMAFDFGLSYSKEKDGIQFGLVLRNVGFQVSRYTEDTSDNAEKGSLPMIIGLGASQFLLNTFTLAGDVSYEEETKTTFFTAGAEFLPYKDIIALRIGYNTMGSDYDTGKSSDFLGGFSTGLGLKYNKISLDYGLNFYGSLGQTHAVQVGYHF